VLNRVLDKEQMTMRRVDKEVIMNDKNSSGEVKQPNLFGTYLSIYNIYILI